MNEMSEAKTRRIPMAAILATALSACGHDVDPAANVSVVDSAGVEIVASDPSSSEDRCDLGDAPLVTLGSNEGAEPHLFHQIRAAARLSDGSIAVVNGSSGEVRVFDETGAHLRSMGGRGEGPGEFRGAWLLWVLPRDSLWVGDYPPWRVNVFSSGGALARVVRPEHLQSHTLIRGGVLDNGTSVNVVQSMGDAGGSLDAPLTYLVMAHDPDGVLLDTLAALPGLRLDPLPQGGGFVPQLFGASSLVAARGSTVAMTTARDSEVRVLDPEFRLRRIVRWTDWGREVTDAHVQAAREDFIADLGGPGSPGWGAVHDAAISDRRPVADLFPSASDLMVGRDGRLWVKRHPPPREEASWMAFAANGAFACHLRPDPQLTPLEFGDGYMLAQHVDELGVERVVMYELLP